MKNLHLIAADKPSSLYFSGNNSELLFLKGYFVHKTFNIKPQNIYITSDEEIKEGDWYIFPLYKKGFTIKRYNSVEHFSKEPCISLANLKAKKIILTTDQDLIKDGVQAIDDEFLEWFVKNPSCEWVDVWLMNKGYNKQEDYPYQEHYLIIIPKEETNGCIGSNGVSDPKLNEVQLNQPKQETLEEELLQQIKFCLICKNDYQAIRLIEKYGFQKQEQMYSEEDMKIAFDANIKDWISFEEFIEQFKNK